MSILWILGQIVEDKQRIFYGLAWVSIADFNPDMLQIEFIGLIIRRYTQV